MYRVFLSATLLMLAAFASITQAGETVRIALAPITVATDAHGAKPNRSNRVLSVLSERIKKLKEEGKDDEAQVTLRRAHQRVRESEEQVKANQKKLHDIVEKIGKGKNVDLDSVRLPMFKKGLAELQAETKKLIKAGKTDAAANLADGMHKKVREGLVEHQSRLKHLHEGIEKIGSGEYVAEAGDGHEGRGGKTAREKKDRQAKDRSEHGHGRGGDHDDDDHGHQAHGDDHDEEVHGKKGHGHHHDDEHEDIDDLLEELEEVREELKEIREMVREIRGMVK